MYALLILVLAIVALCAAKNLPTLAVLGIVTAIAAVLRQRTEEASGRILALTQDGDPWAAPSDETRKLMRRSLKLALVRTELASCFPGRGI